MKKIKLIIGILIILSFVFAPFGTQTSVNDHNTNDSKTITAGINKISANSEKTISWDISNDSFSDVYNYNYSGWEFGPTPSYSLTYNNGTAIGLQDTIYFSDTIIIRINVPIASITSGNGLGQVGFYLSYNKQGTSGDVFDESGYYYYDVNAKTWNYYSSATNRSTGIPVTVNDPTIFNWNSQTANYNSGNNSWTVQFTGSLSSSIPSGKWNFNLQIMDSSDQIVQSYGYNSWNSQNPPYRDLWINAPYDPLSEYGDAYITNVYSNSMKPLDSVSTGIPFEYVINGSTTAPLDKFIWYMSLPNYYYNLSYQLNYVQTPVTKNGSWVWNQTLGTYVWSTSPVTFIQSDWVNQSTEVSTYIDRSVYNPNCLITDPNCSNSPELLLLVYDKNSNKFTIKIGYYWEDYVTYETHYVFERDINPAIINDSLIMINNASFNDLGNNNFGLAINMTFNQVLDTNWYNNINPTIYANETTGVELYNAISTNPIRINSPGAKLEVYDENNQPAGNSLITKLGKFFYVNETLDGYSDLSSIDAATYTLYGYDYQSNATASIATNVNIIITYNLKTHQTTIESYNDTYIDTDTNYYYQFVNNNPNIIQINNVNSQIQNGQLIVSFNLSATAITPQLVYYPYNNYPFETGSFGQDLNTNQGTYTSDFLSNETVLTLNGTYTPFNSDQFSLYLNNNIYPFSSPHFFIQTSSGAYASSNELVSYNSVYYTQGDLSSLNQYPGYTYYDTNYQPYYEFINGTKDYNISNYPSIYYLVNISGQTAKAITNNTSGYFDLFFNNGTIIYGSTSYAFGTDYNGTGLIQSVNINGSTYIVSLDTATTSAIIGGSYYLVNLSTQLILKHVTYYGTPWQTVYTPITTIFGQSDTYSIVIGNPKNNMWGYDSWTVNPNNGAIDLDGDLSTTNDQYFVKQEWNSTTGYSYNATRMWVYINWDPNTAQTNNNYALSAWMGYTTLSYTFDWAQNYYSYYAGNGSLVSPSDMQAIKNLVFSNITSQTANSGYWGVSYMLINETQQDVINQAKANGWNWIPETTWTTSWLDFGFDQNYYTYSQDPFGNSIWSQQDMNTQWNGLFLYNATQGSAPIFNSGQVTHMFIPSSVGTVQFTNPGTSLGVNSNSGSVTLNGNDANYNNTLDFGVQFNNVTGTTYPIIKNANTGDWINIWQWQQGDIAGTDLSNFTDTPTPASIDQIGFKLHFNILPDPQSNGKNAIANLKLDQSIGNWNVSTFNGRKALTNYSLAITYLTAIQASSQYTVNSANDIPVNNTQTVVSPSFSFNTGTKQFGSAILAGPYSWSKNQTTTYNSTTYSAPIGQFQSTYQSNNGDGSTYGFNLTSTMYFLAIGFPHWDGYSVFQDPSFSAVAAVTGQSSSPVITVAPNDKSAPTGSTVQVSWTATSNNPATYVIKDDAGNTICTGQWFSGQAVTCPLPNIKAGAHTYTITFTDANGNSTPGSVVITGTSNTTENSSGTVTASEHTNSISSQSSINKGAPGFELLPLLAVMTLVAPIMIYRRNKNT